MSLRIRRGGGVTAPPPPPAIYGPSDGAASVRSGAGARAVTNPGGGISFNSSGSLQSAINANPTDSLFVCSTNTPLWNSGVDCTTKRPTIIFPGAVGQVDVNANNGNFPFFFALDNVTIKGGSFRNSAYVFQAFTVRNSSVLEDAVVHDNLGTSGSNIGITGTNSRVSYCTIYNGGLQGMQGGATGTVVDHCNIYGNNTTLANPGVTGGAHKFNNSGHAWYHHNYVHDNIGFGAWWDTGCYDWTIEENVCEGNYYASLFYEANWGSTIRHNLIQNTGRNISVGGFGTAAENQVNVRLSDDPCDTVAADGIVYDLDFSYNLIDHTQTLGGGTGRLILCWDHSATAARHAGNYNIHHNQFWLRSGIAGASFIYNLDTATTAYPVWSTGNTYHDNEYRVGDTTTSYWSWGTGTQQGSAQTFAAWQGFHPTGETRILTP